MEDIGSAVGMQSYRGRCKKARSRGHICIHPLHSKDSLSANAIISLANTRISVSYIEHSLSPAPPLRGKVPLTQERTQTLHNRNLTYSLNRSPTSGRHRHSLTWLSTTAPPRRRRNPRPSPFPGPHDFHRRNGSTPTAQILKATQDWVPQWCTYRRAPPYTSMLHDARKPAPSCGRN